MRDYIPVELWRSTYADPQIAKLFTFVERVPISDIKIDKRLFSWQNEIDPAQVDSIVGNFDVDFWMPIMVNPGYFLLDGQHRLQAADKLGLKYIDVVVKYEKETR